MAPHYTYYKWLRRGQSLLAARDQMLKNSVSHSYRKAYWIFEIKERHGWTPSSRISDDRVLIVIVFKQEGEDIIKDQSRWIRFPDDRRFIGEASHPDSIIVKSNEPGAYGIGASLLEELTKYVKEIRLANLKEIAKTLNVTEKQAKNRIKNQQWI